MKQFINTDNWYRKEYFDFFGQFDEPYFGIVSEFDCTKAYKKCKEAGSSFFIYYLHKSLYAANQTEEFRYRIENDKIVLFDVIHASPTISRDDNTFGFSFIPFIESFSEFTEIAQKEIKRIKAIKGLGLEGDNTRLDTIHYSTLPWFDFTGLTHARHFKYKDSCPKITFGKFVEKNKKLIMPVSVNAHHGFMDAYHVAKHLGDFQNLMNG